MGLISLSILHNLFQVFPVMCHLSTYPAFSPALDVSKAGKDAMSMVQIVIFMIQLFYIIAHLIILKITALFPPAVCV